VKQITENVYVETGMRNANLGFVTTKEGIVMIDVPMCPNDAVKWRDEVGKKGEVRYLINQEEHPDHWHTDWFFPGILISHQETRDRLTNVPVADVMKMVEIMEPEGLPLMDGYQLRLPEIVFTERLNIYLGGHTIELFCLPGHSPGGIGVYIPQERVVFTADIVFNKIKSWLNESEPAQWLESLKRLGELDADIVVPGHGGVSNKDCLKEQAGVIQGWVDAVQSAITQGLSEEEAAAKISCPDPHPKQPHTPLTEPELNRLIIARLYKLYSK